MQQSTAGATAPLACLDREAILAVLISLARDEREQAERRSLAPAIWTAWREETPLDETGAGFDSVARLGLATRFAEFFCLGEIGSDDYLTLASDFGACVDVVAASLQRGANAVTFRSSGTTGTPKRCRHEAADLAFEAGQASFLPGDGTVFGLVRPHHIYGFLFTVLGPCLAGRQVIHAEQGPSAMRARNARPGDLIVAAPGIWEMLLSGGAQFAGVHGTTAGGPATSAIWRLAKDAGLASLEDIYGSTETGGLGRRSAPSAPFRLMPTLRRHGEKIERRNTRRALATPPDEISWIDTTHFNLGPRRDGAVTVAGITVHPGEIAAQLACLSGVRSAAVRLSQSGDVRRLEALIVPAQTGPTDALEACVRDAIAATLPAPARPAAYSFANGLPRDANGKSDGWIEAPAT